MRRGQSTAAALLLPLALLAAGCANLEPAYRRPPPPTPQTFPSGGAYGVLSAAPEPAAGGDWRTFVRDRNLTKLIEAALANNRDLRVAVLNVALAREQYRIQAAAQSPSVTGSASGIFEHEPRAVAAGSSKSAASLPSGGIYFQEYAASLGISDYELDLWGRVRSLKSAALERFLATQEARRAVNITLVSEVASGFLAYAADLQRLRVAEETLASDQTTVALTQARLTAGVASLLDVRQAQTALEAAASAVAAQTTRAAQDLNALTLIVGAPIDPSLLPDGRSEDLPALAEVPVGVSSSVLLGRPDVLEAEHQLKAANADIGAARAALLPALRLTGTSGAASLALSQLFKGASGAWLFEPNLSLPIFDGGANLARIRAAKDQRAAAVAVYEKALQTAFSEVADALAQKGTIETQLASQERLVAAAASTYELSLARYRRGVDPFLATLTAQVTLYSARQSLISARLTRAANLVELYRALGGGFGTAAGSTP